jgi:hypothetical protein
LTGEDNIPLSHHAFIYADDDPTYLVDPTGDDADFGDFSAIVDIVSVSATFAVPRVASILKGPSGLALLAFGYWSGSTDYKTIGGEIMHFTVQNQGQLLISLSIGDHGARPAQGSLIALGGYADFEFTALGLEPLPWTFSISISNAFPAPPLPMPSPNDIQSGGSLVFSELYSSWTPP